MAVKLTGWHGADVSLLWPLSAVLGLVTGLGVWWIAYGPRKRGTSPREASPA